MTVIMPSATVTSISGTVEAKFARGLAANEKKIRDRAFKKLKQYMLARSQQSDGGFSREEMIRLWKGLFYCMWMSDKPLVQEELGRNMAELLPILHNIKSSMLYFEVFLKTISREWQGIDRLRMDKFYLLSRFMLQQAFTCAKNNSWEDGVVDWLLSILKSGPLCFTAPTPSSSSGPPLGVRLHFIDIYLDELTACGYDSLSPEKVTSFLLPYCMLVCNTPVATLRDQALDKIFQEIIDQSDVVLKAVAEEQSDVELPEDRLNCDYSAIAEKLFELASKKDASKKNRQKVYSMVKKFREVAGGNLPLDDLPDFEDDDVNDETELENAEEVLAKKLYSEMKKELREEKARKKNYRKEKKKRKRDAVDEAFQDEAFKSEDAIEFDEDSENNNQLHSEDTSAVTTTTSLDETESTRPKKKRKKVSKARAAEKQQKLSVLLGSAFGDESMLDQAHEADGAQNLDTTMDELLKEPSSETTPNELDVDKMMLDFVDELKQQNASPPSKKKRKKSSTKKAEISPVENVEEADEVPDPVPENKTSSGKKKRKSSSTNDANNIVEFTPSLPPTASFLRVAVSKLNKKQQKLKQSTKAAKVEDEEITKSASGKRVSFEMSKTQIQPFKKNERSSVLSPSPLTIAFDPSKTPDFGLLKKRKKTPMTKSAKARTPKSKRPTASDFFAL